MVAAIGAIDRSRSLAADASNHTTCTFHDDGSYIVTGRIFDKDDGYVDYSTTVHVRNVAPTPGIEKAQRGVGQRAAMPGKMATSYQLPATSYQLPAES